MLSVLDLLLFRSKQHYFSIDFSMITDFHSSEYYIESKYNPFGLGVTEGTAGDAFNEPIITSTATLSTNPGLAINVQPSDQTAVVNSNATFTVTPTLTDVTQGAVTYQWSVNGSPASMAIPLQHQH